MTDFDARLAARLGRLDAAVPAPPLPKVRASTASRRRRWRIPVLLAATALLAAASAVTAERYLDPDNPEPRLEAALGQIAASSDCMSATEARPAVQAQLDALGYGEWRIETRPGAADARCVWAGIVVPEHTVILLPASGKELSEAHEALGAELLRECLNRTDAMALVSSVLVSHGLTEFSIHADPWGPQGGPIDQIDAYRAHVADGCFVFVGMGWDANGKPQYYLWGPWP